MGLQIITLTSPNPTVQLKSYTVSFDAYQNRVFYQFHALAQDANGKWILDPNSQWIIGTIAAATGATYTYATFMALTSAQQLAAVTADMNTYYTNLAANAATVATAPTLA